MSSELPRQYRVVRQMIDMHARLRDRCHRRALALDLVILAGAVLFAVTTLADDHAFISLGLDPVQAGTVLRVASVVLFFASVASLRVDWKGLEGRHADAVQRLAELLGAIRRARDAEGDWSAEERDRLTSHYTQVMRSLIPVPPYQFTRLKSKYLRAVEVSRFIDSKPGFPAWLAGIVVSYRAIWGSR